MGSASGEPEPEREAFEDDERVVPLNRVRPGR